MDTIVRLDHPVAKGLDPDEPGGDRLVDEWGSGAVAVGIAVPDLISPVEQPGDLQSLDQILVGVLDPCPCERWYRIGEPALGVNWVDEHVEPCGLQCGEVDLPVGGGHVDQPGSFIRGYLVRWDDPKGAPVALLAEPVERRLIPGSQQVGAPGLLDDADRGPRLWPDRVEPALGDPIPLAIGSDANVGDVLADRHGQVPGKRPRSRRPDEEPVPFGHRAMPARHTKSHRDRRVIDLSVVEVGLEVG